MGKLNLKFKFWDRVYYVTKSGFFKKKIGYSSFLVNRIKYDETILGSRKVKYYAGSGLFKHEHELFISSEEISEYIANNY